MDLAIQQPVNNDGASSGNMLVWAIVCSLLLHIFIVVIVPSVRFDIAKKPEVITIKLVPAVQPKSAPQPILEPIKPVALPPPPKPIEKIPVKLSPKPVVSKPSPLIEPPSHEPVQTVPPVITASPKVEATPVLAAPVANPEPPQPAGPSEVDLNAAKGQYADTLRRELAKDKKYPSIAARRGYQGDVVLDVKLDNNGKVLSASVHNSSGYELLDKEAVAKVFRISSFPLPPEVLRGLTFNVTIPISFKLE